MTDPEKSCELTVFGPSLLLTGDYDVSSWFTSRSLSAGETSTGKNIGQIL
jgi:hypothetical protein